jgi:cyclophilin family peptidyl-prolyl cis-trans isomerase
MIYFTLGLATLVSLGALTMAEAARAAEDEHPLVELDTTYGPIVLELDRAKAPITVDNFLKYVDEGFYNGLIFHRVIPGFMIQGGGMDESMREKTTRAPIQNEARKSGLSNKRGTVAMARTNDPDSATAQFFINLEDKNTFLDPSGGSAGYAVFGKVLSGIETVDAIAKVPTGRKGPHEDVPEKPVVIKGAKRKAKS